MDRGSSGHNRPKLDTIQMSQQLVNGHAMVRPCHRDHVAIKGGGALPSRVNFRGVKGHVQQMPEDTTGDGGAQVSDCQGLHDSQGATRGSLGGQGLSVT